MKTDNLKEKIYQLVDLIDDKEVLKIVFELLDYNLSPERHDISEEDWKIVEQRRVDYQNGKSKGYTREEVREKLRENLKNRKKSIA